MEFLLVKVCRLWGVVYIKISIWINKVFYLLYVNYGLMGDGNIVGLVSV